MIPIGFVSAIPIFSGTRWQVGSFCHLALCFGPTSRRRGCA
jgi:hypothetical protein